METNPYSPPNSKLATGKTVEKKILWWLYFSILILLGVAGFVGNFLSNNISIMFLLSGILDTVCIIGLYGYIREKKILSDIFWAMVFIVLIIKLSIGTFAFFHNYITYTQATNERMVALVGSLSIILALPLIYALWRYTFKTPTIWIKITPDRQ